MYPASTLYNHSQQRGIGMVEILVTLFILSVGLLGVASLQFVGSFSNAEALNRTQSVMIAQQFAERLRVNAVMSTQSDGYVVDNQYFDADIYNFDNLSCSSALPKHACFCQAHPASVPNCHSGNCTANEMAIFDAYQISCAGVRANPNMRVNIFCDDSDASDTDTCTSGSIHSVVVAWPAQSWRGHARELNPKCDLGDSVERDCVVLELTL